MIDPPDTRTRILGVAVPLFASAGFDSVSMRAIANAAGIKAPSLYNHFPDKETLYFDAVAYAFADKAEGITDVLEGSGSAMDRLGAFIENFTRLMEKDPDFRALLQRELLDGDETRLKLVAERVFSRPFQAMTGFAQELAPECDAHMLAISMAGLVLFHFETAPVRQYLPGGKAKHNDPKVIARHVTTLLTKALGAD